MKDKKKDLKKNDLMDRICQKYPIYMYVRQGKNYVILSLDLRLVRHPLRPAKSVTSGYKAQALCQCHIAKNKSSRPKKFLKRSKTPVRFC